MELDKARLARIAWAPKAHHGKLKATWTGEATPEAAIAVFCQECVGYVRGQVSGCSSTACPLWQYRSN